MANNHAASVTGTGGAGGITDAAANGDVSMVEQLLSLGADVNAIQRTYSDNRQVASSLLLPQNTLLDFMPRLSFLSQAGVATPSQQRVTQGTRQLSPCFYCSLRLKSTPAILQTGRRFCARPIKATRLL